MKRNAPVKRVEVTGKAQSFARALGGKHPRGDVKVTLDRNVVELGSLDKVYFPDKGYTKADLFRYLYAVAAVMLPYLKDRPLILKRYPDGVDGKFFFQHDVDRVPTYVETFSTEAQGHKVDYVVCNNRATLLYLANLGVIPIHPWHSRRQSIDHPDYIVFDLDPGKVEFEIVRRVALAVKAFLDRLGLDAYPKTSGSRGMHVYVPLKPRYSYEECARFAERVAKQIVKENPDITTTERALDRRKPNRVYVDYLQNARGNTIVAAYSVRERPAASVSAPLTWKEVEREITPGDFTIATMPGRIRRKGDLFAEVLRNKQTLQDALEKLEAIENR